MNRTGIIQRLKSSASAKEVKELLSELSSYKEANPRTIRKAHSVAQERLEALS